MAGEPAAKSAGLGRVDVQEEAGSWCTTVEGFEAEVEAFIFGVQKVSKLSKLSFKLLSHYAYGGCSGAREPGRRP